MKSYYRVMLGRGSSHAAEGFGGNFIGAGYGIAEDLSGNLPDEWRAFNRRYIPVYLAGHPQKSRIAAGLSCGFLWTVCKGIAKDDVVLCPDGDGAYRVGVVTGPYFYAPGHPLPHRRPVRWLDAPIDRAAMSDALRASTGSVGAVSNVSRHREEIERLIGGGIVEPDPDPAVENHSKFVMEKHLEDFLIHNWALTDFGREYEIYEEDGEPVGQQYQTDTGRPDILAVSKDKTSLLVVELKKGRASDAVVGQILRYMGYVQEMLAEHGQTVRGATIALEDDQRIRRSLLMVPMVAFYRYQVSFKLVKA